MHFSVLGFLEPQSSIERRGTHHIGVTINPPRGAHMRLVANRRTIAMTGALMGYAHENPAVGVSNLGFFYDSRFGNMYGVCSAFLQEGGLCKWDAWPNGNELRVRTLADLGGPTLYFPV